VSNILTKILGDKKEWKAMEARANALPRDYRIVYGEMQSRMWRFTTGEGMDIVALPEEVLGLFEASVAEGKSVLAVTGEDVAAIVRRTPAPYHVVPREVAGLAQPRHCQEAHAIAPC
jgi:DNA-binding ferritin-like protein (Dps family)